ncbi:hypothetical protein EL22_27810 [Halostagnicola sp. A56]|nr:hypothetical protein EL22_27810 [Halostagnicola sp. A56]
MNAIDVTRDVASPLAVFQHGGFVCSPASTRARARPAVVEVKTMAFYEITIKILFPCLCYSIETLT